MIVRCRVLEQTFNLFRSAMTAFSAEVQPPLPVQSMIGFGLAANLVRETKASAAVQKRLYARVQPGFLLDVMQAYRADYDVECSLAEIELFEPLHQETD